MGVAQPLPAARSGARRAAPAAFPNEPVPGSEPECQVLQQRMRELERRLGPARPSISLEDFHSQREIILGRLSALRCRER